MKHFLLLILILILPLSASAAIYYVDDDAADNTGDGLTAGAAKHNIQNALALCNANGGDTVTILDGVYDEAADQITLASLPATSSATTTIQAQNKFGVEIQQTLDCRSDDYVRNYVSLDGLRFTTLGEHGFCGSYWKITNCFFYGMLLVGSNKSSETGFNCAYNLFEDCHIDDYGYRYAFEVYNSSNTISRRVVVRHDGGYSGAQPSAVIQVYSCQNIIFQNCIVIDSPGTANNNWQAAFYTADNVFSGQLRMDNIKWAGCMAVNQADSHAYYIDNISAFATVPFLYDNCVAVNCTGGRSFVNYTDVVGDTVTYNQSMSINNGTDATNYGFGGAGDYYVDAQYSIILNQTGNALGSTNITNYNNAYGCLSDNPGTNGFTTDPETNGLLYPIRIESGSTLETAGDGTRVGANITKQWGTTGTIYGAEGYDTVSDTDLWPWPNEDQIKSDFLSVANASTEARGFCTGNSISGNPQTLTKYIWEYIGSQIPADIYGDTEITNKQLKSGTFYGGSW